ncbi:MAG: hypothetical protein ABR980_12325 [Ignavibacteriaceae bacterium]|jgi:hypothetical protein
MDEKMTPEESLFLITKVIEETKQRFKENGHIIILWGTLTFIVFVSQYILVLLGLYKLFDIAWTCILFPLGGIYSFIYGWKKHKKNNLPKTIIGNIIETMGWVVGINLMILGFLFRNKLGEAGAPVFLILFALFFILTGISIKFKPIIIGGILLNLMGFAAFYINGQYHGLIMATGAVIAMIIPGILLNRANRNEHV